MARSIHWKEKVALDVLLPSAIFILTLINIPAAAQPEADRSNNSTRITYSCHSARLEAVMDYLARNTGYDFIYSRNIIDVSKTISLAVSDKSIADVLLLIERQANITFKIQDRHIIVKSNPKPPLVASRVPTERKALKVTSPSFTSSDSVLLTSTSRTISIQPHESHTLVLQHQLDRRIHELQSLLGPGVPRHISPFDISQVNFNNRHRGWYASVGTYFSENRSGLELQAGLPYLYAVFTPKWAFDQGFTGGYGVGSSVNLVGNFSFNTIYLYSGKTKTESVYPFGPPMTQMGPELRTTESVRHHQVKFSVRYSFSKNLSFRAGPVLNYRNTLRQASFISPNSYPEVTYYGQNSGNGTLTYRNGQAIPATTITRTFESWIGWDASLSYRINFFQRR